MQHPQQQQRQQEKQSVRLRESKWWRSCWNGNQLDGDLLYRTIKAQQERRLTDKMILSDSNTGALCTSQKNHDQTQQTASKANVAQLYATPRLTATAKVQQKNSPQCESLRDFRHNESSSRIEISSSSSSMAIEDDPLSDPLYASILGTSKQLKDITGQAKASRKMGATRSSTSLFTGSEFYPSVAPIYDNLTHNNASSSNDAHLSDSSVDSASSQLKSLVERCLEVQRATQNNRSLLSISHPREDQHQHQQHPQPQEDSFRLKTEFHCEKFGALRQKQM